LTLENIVQVYSAVNQWIVAHRVQLYIRCSEKALMSGAICTQPTVPEHWRRLNTPTQLQKNHLLALS